MNARIPILNLSVGGLLARLALLGIVIIWTVPTFGLFISSLRDKDQLAISGWWTALQTTTAYEQARTGAADAQVNVDGQYVIAGSLFEEGDTKRITAFGGGFLPSSDAIEYVQGEQQGIRDYEPGVPVALEGGGTLTVNADGTYELVSPTPFEFERGQRFFYVADIPPRFTLENYQEIASSEGVYQAFLNTFTVTIPATVIPIAVAAFAAYAFSWMEYPARRVLL